MELSSVLLILDVIVVQRLGGAEEVHPLDSKRSRRTIERGGVVVETRTQGYADFLHHALVCIIAEGQRVITGRATSLGAISVEKASVANAGLDLLRVPRVVRDSRLEL